MEPDLRVVRGPWAELSGEAVAALDGVLAACAAGGVALLPTIPGVAPEVLARWLHRRRVRVGEAAGFGHLGTEHLPGEPAERAQVWGREAARCGGGVLLVEGERTRGDDEALRTEGAARDVAILVPGGPTLAAPDGFALRAAAWDELHAVAMDPSLEAAREAVLALARTAACYRVSGPTGAGRRTLIYWARAAIAPTAFLRVAAPNESVPPGEGWQVFLDADLRDERGAQELLGRVRRRSTRPPPPPPLPGERVERPRDPELAKIVGEDARLAELLWRVKREAPVAGRQLKDAMVLILGPTGAGKEAIAHALHDLSDRRGKPFVAVDLGAMQDLAESRLFGLDGKGLNVDAHPGLFEQARGGTLFLDEVGRASMAVQQVLLRALSAFRARRVNGRDDYVIDARVVFATNCDLEAMVAAGTFNADLCKRISGCQLVVPSLEDRPGDLAELARTQHAEVFRGWDISDDVIRALRKRTWEGNVRELRNVLRDAQGRVGDRPLRPEDVIRPDSPVVWTTTRREGGASVRAARLPDGTGVDIGGAADRRDAAREAVRAAVAPRPITPQAVELLARSAWWGNFRDIRDVLGSVHGLPPGPVDVETVRRLFAGRAELDEPDDLVLILAPRVVRRAVVGFEQVVPHEAVVLGRVPSVVLEAPRKHRKPGDGEGHDWSVDARWIEAECGRRTPVPLELSGLAFVSRAQLLLRQEGTGIRVGRLPGGKLALRVTSLHDGAVAALSPGQAVSCGPAVDIELASADGRTVLLRMYAVRGQEGRASLGDYVTEGGDGSAVTLVPGMGGETISGQPQPPPRVWELGAGEREAFVAFVVDHVASGAASFSAALDVATCRWTADPALARLGTYLSREDAARRNTYALRLADYPPNRALRDELRVVLAAVAVERRRRLPAWLRKLAPEPDEEGGDA